MNWKTALADYANYLRIERGLSSNTIKNYTLDVQKLSGWLDEHAIAVSPAKIEPEQIQQFIYEIAKVVNPRTQSRIISGLKGFFNYLIFEKYRESNPLELLETPKIGRKLPDTLSQEEVDLLLSAIDLSHPQGTRNRAMMETLYGSGLRVTELVELKLSDLFFDEVHGLDHEFLRLRSLIQDDLRELFEVLHFRSRAEFAGARLAHGNIGVAAK